MLLMNNKRGKPSSKRSLSCAPSWVSIQNRETTQRNLKRDSCSLNHHHYLLFIIDSFLMFCCKLAKENWIQFWFCCFSILTNLVNIIISINVEAVHQLHGFRELQADFHTGKKRLSYIFGGKWASILIWLELMHLKLSLANLPC